MTGRAILVGVNASSASQVAVAWATREAALRGIGVHLIHAADEQAYGLWLAPQPIREGLRELALPTLMNAENLARTVDPSVPVTGQVVIGPPPLVLARRAPWYELVVVGRPNWLPISRRLGGTVPRHLISEAFGPTVIAGASLATAVTTRIVVAIDGPSAQDEPIAFAFQEALRRDIPLLAVHAWHVTSMPPLGMSVSQSHPAALSARSFNELRHRIETWRALYPDVRVSVRSSEGAASRLLPSLCEPSDLLVIGHRRPAHVIAHHVGPIAAAALREASCPIAVIPMAALAESGHTETTRDLAYS